MSGRELSSLIQRILLRLARLEDDMTEIKPKERDLRTIMIDGFAEMRQKFASIDTRFDTVDLRFDHLDERLNNHDEQMETLAYELKTRTDAIASRIDKLHQETHGKLDRILQALNLA